MECSPGSTAGIGNARLFGLPSSKKETHGNEGVGAGHSTAGLKSPRAQLVMREEGRE